MNFICKYLYRHLSLTISGLIFLMYSVAQCPPGTLIGDKITALTNNKGLNDNEKLSELYELKAAADGCRRTKDSIYAIILSKIGAYERNLNSRFYESIAFTKEAIYINSLYHNNSCTKNQINNYINLAYYYKDVLQHNNAISSCDSAIILSVKFQDDPNSVRAKVLKANIFYSAGDYQKCIDECTKGIVYALSKNSTDNYVEFLNQRSQSLFFQKRLSESLADIALIFKNTKNLFDRASALKTKGLVYEKQGLYALAKDCFTQSVNLRIKYNLHAQYKRYDQVIDDYIDLGNFYFNSLRSFQDAKKSYNKGIEYVSKHDSARLAAIYTNLGMLSSEEQEYQKAATYYLKTFAVLKISAGKNILSDPPAVRISAIGNTDLVTDLLTNKVLLFLKLFRKTGDKKYLHSTISTALVTDTVITQKRYQQLGEESKLYWRDRTRGFFTNAIEACFLANDVAHAFYFMEESRSVLLNDKLNELGASAVLSPADSLKEQDLKIKVTEEQQRLIGIPLNAAAYQNQMQAYLNIKQELENFIKSLEEKYPAYYSYKYSDSVPSLKNLQQYLSKNNASFVHYFTNDTLAYILCITAAGARMIKLNKNEFSYPQINDFLAMCANKNRLNTKSSYYKFTALSYKLYQTLFQTLQLQKGRVIICSDNFLLPFEALCSDVAGKNFLINNYVFSYAYSATYLLKIARPSVPKGNFIGFAPVSFPACYSMPALKNSEPALVSSAEPYASTSTRLFIKSDATKYNFIQNIASYSVANIFSHASSSNDSEPRLYMADSLINLSDLQLLHHPATQLIILSACQTNVGKYATGEGIYSLARGFASAGIPSVSATLWQADQDMIYKVSVNFNKYLALGISKDSALNQAKLDFIKDNNSIEKSLPYYWANIILIGNTAPLELSAGTNLHMGWIIAGASIVFIFIIVLLAWKIDKNNRST